MDLAYESHRRLPSIQNILGPSVESAIPSARIPRPFSHAPAYHRDPFRLDLPASLAKPTSRSQPPPTPQHAAVSLPRHDSSQHVQSLPSILTRNPTGYGDDAPRPPPSHHSAVTSYQSSITHSGPASPSVASRCDAAYPAPPAGHDDPSPHDSSPRQVDSHSRRGSPHLPGGHSVRNLPGHGDCYVMPDGTFLPCQINGDPVNPEFGVTKAGKPRKRLAQACVTCREKKIKCQPGEPKCHQCTKLNRECKRPAAPSIVARDASAPSESILPPVPVAARFDIAAKPESPPPLSRKRPTADAIGVTPALSYSKPPMYEREDMAQGPKRQCASGRALPASPGYSSRSEHAPRPVPALPSGFDSASMDLSSEDPFEKDPYLAVEFLDLYFQHRGRGLYEVLPQDAFMRWVVECRNKRRDELMMLYTLLAVGSRFCLDRKKKSVGTKYAKKAAFMEREHLGENSLQLAQTRLYFLLYYFADGNNALGWDYLCAGMGTCNALGLNTEQGVNDIGNDSSLYDYGFTPFQLTECRRRTFFAGYCMDRYIGHNSGHSCLVHDDDIFLRLPGREDAFRRGADAPAGPYFSEGQLCEPFSEEPGEMACLIPIVSVWGEVVAHAWRSLHRPSAHAYLHRYEQHYARTYQRVATWEDSLPAKLRFNPKNTETAVATGCASAYFVLHAIRFVALIKLNRNADVNLLPPDVKSHNISRALMEAHSILSISSMLSQYVPGSASDADVLNACSQPFPGYAVLAACEVVSAGGLPQSRSRVQKELSDAAVVLEQIGRFWFAGGKQQAKVHKCLARISGHDGEAGHERALWRLPVTKDVMDFFPEHYDLLHACPDELFFEAVRRV